MIATGHIIARFRLSMNECEHFKTKIMKAATRKDIPIEKRAIGVLAKASTFEDMFVRTNEELQQLQYINDDIRVPFKVMSNELTQEQAQQGDTGKIRLLLEVIY